MLLEDYDKLDRPGRAWSFLLSLGIHGLVVAALLLLPPLPDMPWGREEPDLMLKELEAVRNPRKVIWLRKKERLPDISPTPEKSDRAAARSKIPRTVVRANPSNAIHKDQFIFVPFPKVEEQKPIPSPNVVMTNLLGSTPPKPEPKKFVAPESPPPAKPRDVELKEPEVAQRKGPGLDSKPPSIMTKLEFTKPAPKTFVPPPEKPRETQTKLVEAPEGLPMAPGTLANPKLSIANGQIDAPKPAPKKFVPPEALAGSGGLGGSPKGSPAGQALSVPDVPAAPGSPGKLGEISAVIISENPLASGRIIPPEGNRQAKIGSDADPGGGKGGGSGKSAGGGLVVPGVTVRGGDAEAGGGAAGPSRAPAVAAPTPSATPSRLPDYRRNLNTPSISVPLRPNSRRVPPQVEDAFRDRVVYCTVMPGPSSLPDWVIWYGESQQASSGARVVMRPPVAERTELPAKVINMQAGGRLWVVARLGKNGRVSSVNVSLGVGAEQALALASEIEKWSFSPAIRNGEAVEVDVVVEADLKAARN
jgi:hypothetical protein